MNTNSWLQYTENINRVGNTYIRDFLDVSGNIVLRNGNFNMTGGDISMNSSFYILGNGALKLNSDNAGSYFQSGANLTTGTTRDIIFSGINKTPEYMRIKGGAGYIGINTTTPGTYALYVNGSSRFSVPPIMLGTNIYSGVYNDGKKNTGVGIFSLFNNTLNNHTALGVYSSYAPESSNMSAMGYNAGYQSTNAGHSGFGSYSLYNMKIGGGGFNNSAFGYKSFYGRGGNSNSAFGAYSLYNERIENNVAPGVGGFYNNAFGYYAMNISGGNSHNAFGYYAMYSRQTLQNVMYNNIAVGSNSLLTANGSNLLGFGGNTLLSNTTGSNNTSIGYSSLSKNVSGAGLVAIGSLSQNSSNNVNNATTFGYQSLYSNTTGGGSSVSFGTRSLLNLTTSPNINVVAFGNDTMVNCSVGYNTCFGGFSLYNITTSINNTAFGFYSIYSNNVGSNDVAFGHQSGLNLNSSSSQSSVFGYQSSINATAFSTCFGSQSLMNSGGQQHNAFGYQSMMNALNATIANNAIGCFSLFNSGGTHNTAVGSYSQYLTTTGTSNSSFGNYSLYSNISGTGNTAFGFGSMYSNTVGSYNCSFGGLSLENNIIGKDNVAFGHQSLINNTNGGNNIAFGTNSLCYNVLGDSNISIGSSSLPQCLNDFSLFLDGTEYCKMPQQSYYDLSVGTFECWIMPFPVGYYSSASNMTVKKSSYYCVAYKNFAIFVRNGMVLVYDFYNNNVFYGDVVVSDGKWHHIALVYNSGVVNGSRLYIDGMLNQVFTFYGLSYGGTSNNIYPNTQIRDTIFRIGAFYTIYEFLVVEYNNFMGGIDEARMWNTLRSDADILSNYNVSVNPTTNGLVGYWKMDEGGGNTLFNCVPGGYDFPITGTPVWSSFTPTIYQPTQNNVSSINEYSLFFNGRNQNGVISSASYYAYSIGTVECWINISSYPASSSYMGILVKPYAYGLYILNNGVGTYLIFYNYTGFVTNLGITSLSLDTWYHVAFTFQSGVTNGSNMYLNGKLEKNGTITVSNQNNVLLLGSADSIQYFNGYIDEVRVWNVVRTRSQIQQTYNTRISRNTPGLTGYWTMDQGTGGTLLNIATGGYNFNLVNYPTFFSNNYSLQFNGTNSQIAKVSSPTYYAYSNGTVECWINLSSTGTDWQTIISKTNAYSLYAYKSSNTYYLAFFNWTGLVNNVGITPLSYNTWYHVAYTFQSGVANGSNIYLNGNLEKNGTNTVVNQISSFTIGNDNNEPWNGYLDEVRVWSTVRTRAQIQQNYTIRINPNTSGLTGYWIMEQNAGTILYNLVKGGYDLSLNSSPAFSANPSPLTSNVPVSPPSLYQYSYGSFNNISSNTTTLNSSSYRFNGTSDFAKLSFDNNTATADVNPYFFENGTIEFWFNPKSPKCLMNYGNYLYVFVANSTQLQLLNYPETIYNSSIVSTINISTPSLYNSWHHFAISYKNSITNETSFYVDGQPTTNGTIKIPNLLRFINNEYNQSYPCILQLGYDGSSFYDGCMNEIRFWDYPLSSDEIKNMYNKRISPYTQGLAGYWTMDDNGKNVFTNSVKGGPNFVLSSAGTSWTGSAGPSLTNYQGIDHTQIDNKYVLIANNISACYFNGTNNHWNAGVSSNFAYSTGTIECWVNLSALPASSAYMGIISKQNAYSLLIFNNGTATYFGFFNSTGSVTNIGITRLSINTWYHVAFTFQSAVANGSNLYLNGNLEKNGTITVVNQNSLMRFGSPDGTSQFFNGYVDELRIWNVVRTATEIQQSYNVKIAITISGLTGYWNMDQTSGLTVLYNLVSDQPNLSASPTVPAMVKYGTTVSAPIDNNLGSVNNNNNLLIGANADVGIFATNNYCTRFNGTSNSWNASASTHYAYSSGTIECWMNLSALPTNGTYAGLILKRQAYGLYAVNSGGTIYFTFYNWGTGGGDNIYATPIVTNTWYHVAFTFQLGIANGCILYVNGKFARTGTVNLSTQTAIFTIGSTIGVQDYHNGYIDEARVWSTVRTPAQILENYNKRISVTTPGLTGYWTMEQGSGTTLYNLAPGGFNLTASATAPTFVLYNTLTTFDNPQLFVGDYAGAIGYNSIATNPDSLYLGTSLGNVYVQGRLWVGNTLTVGTTIYTSSDKRIKTDILPMHQEQNTDKLRPVSYFNTLIRKDEIGFIAQEVEEEYPFLVTSCDYDGYKSLNYNGIVAINVNEIQNLHKIYEENEKLLEKNSILITKMKKSLENDFGNFGNNIIV